MQMPGRSDMANRISYAVARMSPAKSSNAWTALREIEALPSVADAKEAKPQAAG